MGLRVALGCLQSRRWWWDEEARKRSEIWSSGLGSAWKFRSWRTGRQPQCTVRRLLVAGCASLPELIYVFGWEMGVNQGELVGRQEALPSDKDAANQCILNGTMNRITKGVSMGDMVAMADNYYDDPKHAADPPTTALINSLFLHAK